MLTKERPLGGYLRAISNAMAQDLQQQTEQLGLTCSQGMFLHHIWKRQTQEHLDTYPKDLEEFFYVKHPTVSGILQRMEASGFLTLEASAEDRRCKVIRLTKKAMDAHSTIAAHLEASEAQLTMGMDDAQRTQFRALLQLAAKNLGVCCKPPVINEKEVSL